MRGQLYVWSDTSYLLLSIMKGETNIYTLWHMRKSPHNCYLLSVQLPYILKSLIVSLMPDYVNNYTFLHAACQCQKLYRSQTCPTFLKAFSFSSLHCSGSNCDKAMRQTYFQQSKVFNKIRLFPGL